MQARYPGVEIGGPDDTVILAGAGISLDWPSCFPIGSQIIASLANWLGDGDEEQTERAKRALSRRGLNPYAFTRFELVWETLELIAPGISRCMEALEVFGAPNRNHHAIAKILDDGGSLITTNFDRRIERALEGLGSDIRPWVFGERPRKPKPESRYFKIHGSFGHRRKLLSSLFSIGQAGLGFARFPSLRAALRDVVFDRTLVVAGYSFSDHFDVVPLIESELRPRQIIWVRYDPNTERGRAEPFTAVDALPIPEPQLSFEESFLANFRANCPDCSVWQFAHSSIAAALSELGLVCSEDIRTGEAETEAAQLNQTAFEIDLDDSEMTSSWKQFAVQMLERRDGFGFHAALDTSIDNDWTLLEPPPGTEPEEAPLENNALFENVAALAKAGDLSGAEAELAQYKADHPTDRDRSYLLAAALCAREAGRIETAYQYQLDYMAASSSLPVYATDRINIEDIEIAAALALDYIDVAIDKMNTDFAKSLLRRLNELFQQSGLIWIAIEREVAIARLGISTLDVSGQGEFEDAWSAAERAAYYAWRSGRWDLAWTAANYLSWYLSLSGRAIVGTDMLERVRSICPDSETQAWVVMTSNIALNHALYGDREIARAEIKAMQARMDDAEEGELFYLTCLAALQCADGDPAQGSRTIGRAKEIIGRVEHVTYDHDSCLRAIKDRFDLKSC